MSQIFAKIKKKWLSLVLKSLIILLRYILCTFKTVIMSLPSLASFYPSEKNKSFQFSLLLVKLCRKFSLYRYSCIKIHLLMFNLRIPKRKISSSGHPGIYILHTYQQIYRVGIPFISFCFMLFFPSLVASDF